VPKLFICLTSSWWCGSRPLPLLGPLPVGTCSHPSSGRAGDGTCGLGALPLAAGPRAGRGFVPRPLGWLEVGLTFPGGPCQPPTLPRLRGTLRPPQPSPRLAGMGKPELLVGRWLGACGKWLLSRALGWVGAPGQVPLYLLLSLNRSVPHARPPSPIRTLESRSTVPGTLKYPLAAVIYMQKRVLLPKPAAGWLRLHCWAPSHTRHFRDSVGWLVGFFPWQNVGS